MKFKTVVLLAVAVGCGLVAMLGVQQLTKKGGSEEEYAQILFAATEITSGTMLDESNVTFKRWPKDQVPEGAVITPEQYEQRSIRGNVVPGEMILLAKLSEKGVWGASADIPEGMRVVTVPVDLTKSHSGLIQAGDRVDVMVTYKSRNEGGMGTRTRTFLEAIKVFATDSRRASEVTKEGEEVKAKNISLLVTPEQANLVMLATNKGQIHLALRHKGDTTVANTASIGDYIFEDGDALANVGDMHDDLSGADSLESTGADSEPEPVDAVRSALQMELNRQIEQQPTAATATTAEAAPEKKTWKIQIYAGNTLRVEEIELPADEQPSPDAAI
jgi:pilus assembly protein CpaB